jgi:wobble nucleotide-excising tRNase
MTDLENLVVGTLIASIPGCIAAYFAWRAKRASMPVEKKEADTAGAQAIGQGAEHLSSAYTALITDLRTQITTNEAQHKVEIKELTDRFNDQIARQNSRISNLEYGVRKLSEQLKKHDLKPDWVMAEAPR